MLDIGRSEDHWYRETEAQPKLVTKHGDGVSGVTVVTRVGLGHVVWAWCVVWSMFNSETSNRTLLGLALGIRKRWCPDSTL